MANYENLKAAIDALIKANGQQEITGPILNAVLKAMVDSLGAGFELAGVATPSTNPGTPDQDVYWLAYQGGTYTNFGGAVLPTGISMLKWDGSWTAQTFFTVDDQLTPNSNNLAKSGAAFDAVMQSGVFDLSAYNSGAEYADLSAALLALNSLPAAYKRGGMSIKFVHTDDNKYVQYRLMSDTFNTTVANWQGVDDEPTAGSGNLVESGGVHFATKGIYNVHKGWMTATTHLVSNLKTDSHFVIPVAVGDEIIVSKNDSYQTFIAFLATYVIPTENGQEYDYVGGRITVPGNFTKYTVPEGANYLWIGLINSQVEHTPSFLKVNNKVIITNNIVDDEPTAGSDNLVKSGGVQNELALGAIYDVSAKNPTAGSNNDGTWESLSALLSDANLNTLIPTFVRKGGMSIKFIQLTPAIYAVVKTEGVETQPTGTEVQEALNLESGTYTAAQITGVTPPASGSVTYYLTVTETVDEQEVTTYITWVIAKATSDVQKYVQYRYMEADATTAATFTNVANWQGVDSNLNPNSKGLVENKTIYNEVYDLKEAKDIAFSEDYKYIDTSGDTISLIPATSSSTKWKYAIAPFVKGMFAVFNAEGNSSNANPIVIVDKNLNITRRNINTNAYRGITVALDGDAYIIINSKNPSSRSLTIINHNSTEFLATDGMEKTEWIENKYSGKVGTGYLYGNDSSFVNGNAIPVESGKFYKIVPNKITWESTGVGGEHKYIISGYSNPSESKIIDFVDVDSRQASVLPEYIISIPNNVSYIRIGGRAPFGECIKSDIYDVSKTCIDEVADDVYGETKKMLPLSLTSETTSIIEYPFIRGAKYKFTWNLPNNSSVRLSASIGIPDSIDTFADGILLEDYDGVYNFVAKKEGTYLRIRLTVISGSMPNNFAINLVGDENGIIYDALNDYHNSRKIDYNLHELEYNFVGTPSHAGQGFCKVGNYYVIGDKSNDSFDTGASNYGYIYIYDSNYVLLGSIKHNLGHMTGLSYDSQRDVMLSANGNVNVSPRVDILLNVTSMINAAINQEDVSYLFGGSNVISIPLKTDSKDLLENADGASWCFAGNYRTVIISLRDSVTKNRNFYLATLGLGDINLSGSSNKNWGTFISGKEALEYNGTLIIDEIYEGTDIKSTQGMIYDCGYLIITSSTSECLVNKVELLERKYRTIKQFIASDYKNDGTRYHYEPEDLVRVGYSHYLCSTTRGVIEFYI